MTLRCLVITAVLWGLAVAPRVESDDNPKYTVLAIEYFGALDKPIPPIVISSSYGGAEWYRNTQTTKEVTWDDWHLASLHAVGLPLLGKLIHDVESHNGGVQQEPEHRYSYNGVSLTILTPQSRKTLLFHVEPAMSLLDQLENLCKDNQSLSSDLLEFQKRVRPWGNSSSPGPVPQ